MQKSTNKYVDLAPLKGQLKDAISERIVDEVIGVLETELEAAYEQGRQVGKREAMTELMTKLTGEVPTTDIKKVVEPASAPSIKVVRDVVEPVVVSGYTRSKPDTSKRKATPLAVRRHQASGHTTKAFLWTATRSKRLRELAVAGVPPSRMATILNAEFGTEFTAGAVRAQRAKLGLPGTPGYEKQIRHLYNLRGHPENGNGQLDASGAGGLAAAASIAAE